MRTDPAGVTYFEYRGTVPVKPAPQGRRLEMCMVSGQQQGRDGRYEMVEVSVNKSPERWREGKERGRKRMGTHTQS